MPIVFRCPTISTFDPQTQQYLRCNERLVASDDSAGGLKECPKCGELVDVPSYSEEPESGGGPSTSSAVSGGSAGAQSEVDRTSGVGQEPRSSASAWGTQRGVSTAGARATSSPSSSVMDDDDLPVATSKLQQTPRTHKPCRICRTPIPPGVSDCPKCGAARRSDMGAELPLEKIKPEPAGFQLSMSRGLVSGLSGQVVAVFATSILILFTSLVIGVGMVSSLQLLFAVLPILIIAWMMLIYFWTQGLRVARVPGAELGSFQRLSWNLVAAFSNAFDWSLRGAIPKEERLDLRGTQVTDQTLLTEPRITQARLIDLRGSGITDEGLRYLRSNLKLRYLRLNGTKVTTEGVFRLQQTIPKCWIWW